MQFVFYLLATTILAQHDLADFKCPDNQHTVAVGCSSTEQCIPYTTEFVTCIDGACCIENNPDDLPYPIPPICSNGGIALAVDCTESQQCSPYTEEPVACLQGTCCTVSFSFLPILKTIIGLRISPTFSTKCVSILITPRKY